MMVVTVYAALGTPIATTLDRSTTATRARRARRSVTLVSASALLAPRRRSAALRAVGPALPRTTMPRTAATAIAACATLIVTRKGRRHTAANLLLRFVVLLAFALLRRAQPRLLRAPSNKRRWLLLPLLQPQPLPLPLRRAFRGHGLAASPSTTPTMVVTASAARMIRTVRPAHRTATTSMVVALDKYAQPASARPLGLSCSPARRLNLHLPRRRHLRLPRLPPRLPL